MTANETFDQFDRHRQAHELRERFESAWRAGQQPQLEHYLNEFAADGCEILLTDLLGVELELRLAEGAPPQLDEYRRRFPQHGALVDQVFAEVLATTEASGQGGLRAGMRLGEFRILREVGRGGMGVIYEAVQETLGRTVALKVLSPLLAATPERVRRFAREARVVAHLHHTNIVEVYGTGGSDGWRYMAMQFVPGQGLDRILQNECLRSDCPYRRGSVEAVRPAVPALPWGPTMADRCRTVARVGQQIASALAYAHGRAVLHHDVKPSNILLDPQGTAWLTDFGLARLMETESVAAEHGHVAGTLRYMAPEVFDGQGDERSDVYGLGLTLYELLSGCDRCREAGESEGESSPQAIVHRARPRLELTRPEASRDLVTIVHKAIDQEPARRYDSAGELAADLERFLRDEPIRARRVGPAERGAWWCRKNPGFASLSCGALLLLLLGTSLSLWAAAHFRRQEAQQRLLVIAGQQLAVRNAGLAAENAVARDQAQAAQRQAQLTLADMFTAHGLQASDNGQDREALLWFAHAASIYEELETERTPRDVGLRPEPPQTSSDEAAGAAQLRASVNRVRLGARRLARPVAVFRNQALVDRLFIHPSQRYVLMRPFLGWPGALWDAQTEQPVVLPPAATPAQALAWTPDGQRLAVGQWDKVTLFQFPELTEPQEIPCGLAVRAGPGAAGMAGSESQLTANAVGSDGQPALVQRLEFDASGRYLAIASYRAVRIWDGERQDFTGPPWPHPAPIQCLVFSSDSRYLVTGAADDRFRLFAVTASQTAPTCEGPHRTNTTWTFVAPRFTEDSRHLVTRAEKEKLGVWEVDARQLAREIPSPVGVIYCLEPISTDGELLVGGTNGLAVVHPRHDVERPPLTTLATVVAAFDPRQQLALVGRGVRECQLWSLPEWRQQPCPAVHPEGCRSVAFSADGRCFVTAGYDHNVRLWAMPQPDPATFTARVAGGTIHIGAFSPDSRYVAVTAGCRTTQIYDAYTGQQVGQVDAREEPGCFGINALLLPDNERLAVYMALPNGAGRLDVWNWHTGEPLSATALASWPPRFLYPVLCANRDGNRLVTLGQQGQVQVFDMATPAARPWRKWDGDQGFKWFRLSPDGCFLAGATPTSAVLWNIETGELRGHFDQQAEITDAAFSQDGRFLASSSRDGAVKVWNLQTQTLAAGPLVHPAHVYTVEFSPDGRYLLTIAKDASARVWNIASGQLAAAPITGFEDITARFRRAVSQLVLTDYEGHFEAWDWRRHQRLMPTQRLFWERAFAWSGQRSLVLSPDGRLAAVGGNKELHIVNLRPLDVTEVPPIQELVTEAEVLSHLRMLDTGATANLTFEEWYGRWESLRAARRGGQE